MSQITIISFTQTGNQLNENLKKALEKQGYNCESYSAKVTTGGRGLQCIPTDRNGWIGELWGYTSFIFIGATGIAIRYISPWICDKYTDSGVLAMDEKGQYVIPLIAGHVGGAVALARNVAKIIGSIPVLTTATDVQGKFAVDVFAKEQGLTISSRTLAKEISAAVLENEKIGFYAGADILRVAPTNVVSVKTMGELAHFKYGIAVMTTDEIDKKQSYLKAELTQVLYLVPEVKPRNYEKNIVVGIGCRKGITKEHIKKQLSILLQTKGLEIHNVKWLASIDVKKEEPGIIALAKEYNMEYITYTKEELSSITSVSSGSSFVQQTVGVDNVCERAAKLAAPRGSLLQPKVCMEGVTFSIVQEEYPKILILAGTTEGRQLVEYLRTTSIKAMVYVATEYGSSCLEPKEQTNKSNIEIRNGRLNASQMEALIKEEEIELVVDATHPFAIVVTDNIKSACDRTGTRYLRVLRQTKELQEQEIGVMDKQTLGKEVLYVQTIEEAVRYLQTTQGNILIATGSKELKEYTCLLDYKERCYARVLSTRQSVEDSTKLGFQGAHLIAMQGPFSINMNVATLKQTNASYFVTKESGITGGFVEKLEAAREVGAQLIVIGSPKEEGLTIEETIEVMKGI